MAMDPEERRERRRKQQQVRRANHIVTEAKEYDTLTPYERKCKGTVRVRDEAGEPMVDADGKWVRRPCKNQAIRGGRVCGAHGGNAPQVKAKAQRRLNALCEPALVVMEKLMLQEDHLPTAFHASAHILDRTLGKAGAVAADKGDGKPVVQIGISLGGLDMTKLQVAVGSRVALPEATVDADVVEDDNDE